VRRPTLIDACTGAAALVAEAAMFRLTVGGASLLDQLTGVLAAAGFVIAGVLAAPRSPAIAWPSITIATFLASVEVFAVIRSRELAVTAASWTELSWVTAVTLVVGTLVAAAYAGREWRRSLASRLLGFLVLGAGVLAAVVVAVSASSPVDPDAAATGATPFRVAARIGVATIAAGLLIGLTVDVARPAARAYRRWRANGAPSGGALWRFLALFAEEVLPGRATERRAGAEAERARLAADLHALVLPDLRRAAAAAEAAGVPADAQVDLRRALEDVEQLMHERQSVVLEQFGLVAAFEWLAERTQERSPIRVDLEIDGEVPDGPGAVEPGVARAAFRIALLALDNAVRHAGATTATVRLSARPEALRLEVVDDGTAHLAVGPAAGRGLADMRTEASTSGGAIALTLEPSVRVAAEWPRATAARTAASEDAALRDRRNARDTELSA
jgi:signal transduction histidine kinase